MRFETFTRSLAANVATWPASAEEARDWAGVSVAWPVTAADIRRWHEDPDVHPFVLHDGADAVAYGELWIDAEEHEAELARIIVRSDRRGRGVGRLLVGLLLEQASAFGSLVAFVRVAPGNAAALASYRRAGFTGVGESERARFNRGQPADYEWLRRELTGPASG